MITHRWRALIAVAMIAVAMIAGGASVVSHAHGRDATTRSFQQLPPVQPGAAPIVADSDNQLEDDEQHEAKGPMYSEEAGADFHEDTRDETPAGIDPTVVKAGQEKTDALADNTLKPPVEPAGAQSYGCAIRYVRNQSALTAKRVGVALHFTVSPFGSINSIRGLFDTPSFGASSNYGVEIGRRFECQIWVPDSRKAWAQGAANSAYISIEIVTNNLTRAQWLATVGIRGGQLAALVRDLARKVGAPLRLVDPVGCVFPAGITDHERLECGNSHWDVGPNFPWDVFMRQVRAGTPASASAPPLNLKVLTRGELANANCLLDERRSAKRHGGWGKIAPSHLRRAIRCKTALEARNRELHRLGLTPKLNRRARHEVIHKVQRRQ